MEFFWCGFFSLGFLGTHECVSKGTPCFIDALFKFLFGKYLKLMNISELISSVIAELEVCLVVLLKIIHLFATIIRR